MDRSTPTARQARRSDTWYASRAQWTKARRAAGLTIFSERLVEDRLV
jgi:hypothetical protein